LVVEVVVTEPDPKAAKDGGQGSSALSQPMREDSPAARITPQRLDVWAMKGR
jgi:hypothetical protein